MKILFTRPHEVPNLYDFSLLFSFLYNQSLLVLSHSPLYISHKQWKTVSNYPNNWLPLFISHTLPDWNVWSDPFGLYITSSVKEQKQNRTQTCVSAGCDISFSPKYRPCSSLHSHKYIHCLSLPPQRLQYYFLADCKMIHIYYRLI